ncbi:MAG TPA: DUF5597 domain-containing protein [Tepidisphaeraceae bacterium]|jgi:hypothetical protein
MRHSIWLLLFVSACARLAPSLSNQPAAHLEKRGNVTQLIVDGQPYLVLGGELRNSSSSSVEYMQPIWPKLAKMHLNTVLAAVTWEQIEPEEGKFDFTVVDGLLRDARRSHLRLILLWFGSWKNGTSRYAPEWVKANQQRFPRVVNSEGKALEILSTFSEANLSADSRAYAALMRHIGQIDSGWHTVIMMQMQNEVGVLGDSRDRSPAANAESGGPVPAELMDYLKAHKDSLLPEFRKVWEDAGAKPAGTWQEVFGKGAAADEIFMAWNYARYCDSIAAAAKAEYALPTFVNTWIVQPEDKGPGDYPSGGPVSHVHDVWRAGAPHIDILAPDLYLPEFTDLAARYSRAGNTLFVPEARAGTIGAAQTFYAIGQHAAIGYSPFAIEERELDPENGPMAQAYDVLSQLSPLILEHQTDGAIGAVLLNQQTPATQVQLGNYRLNIELRRTRRSTILPTLGYALFIAIGPDEYLVAGTDVQITFSPTTPGPHIAGLARVEEGRFVNGTWRPGRLLNGDEVQLTYDLSAAARASQSGAGIRLPAGAPTIQCVKLYRYQ